MTNIFCHIYKKSLKISATSSLLEIILPFSCKIIFDSDLKPFFEKYTAWWFAKNLFAYSHQCIFPKKYLFSDLFQIIDIISSYSVLFPCFGIFVFQKFWLIHFLFVNCLMHIPVHIRYLILFFFLYAVFKSTCLLTIFDSSFSKVW